MNYNFFLFININFDLHLMDIFSVSHLINKKKRNNNKKERDNSKIICTCDNIVDVI